jgi:ribose transport system substrate-binding protein
MIRHGTLMNRLKLVVSLITHDNDYQLEQAAAAEEAASRLGANLSVIYAESDGILQSQQLLKLIQSNSDALPDGMLVEPAGGTGLPQVARAAAAAGIGWVLLNREGEYLDNLRRSYRIPIFGVSTDHEEVGRIQGCQVAALLPKGGSVLYLQGPSESSVTKQRTSGLCETKPSEVQVKMLKGQWTEASAYKAVTGWLRLSTSQHSFTDAIVAQNDAMAVGAKKAFQDLADHELRERWTSLPYLGCDGVPKTGQAWVRSGMLTATVITQSVTGPAVEMLVRALQTGTLPPERTLKHPHSFPAVEQLSVQAPKTRFTSAGKH